MAQGRLKRPGEARDQMAADPGFKDHFSADARRYARARPRYPEALIAWLAHAAPARHLAWDAGCGNGQAALALAAHFDTVYASDPSATQIAAATPHPRIRYAVEAAESPALDDAGTDLVVVAQALHWFDFARFFDSVARVLKPRGVFAAWTYALMHVDADVDRAIANFDATTVGRWWPPERRHVDDGYASIPIPFARLAAPPFEMVVGWNFADVLDYLGTWSAVARHDKATAMSAIALLEPVLAEAWGDRTAIRAVRFPLSVIVARA